MREHPIKVRSKNMVAVTTVKGEDALINLDEVDSMIVEKPDVCRVNFKGHNDGIGDTLHVTIFNGCIFKKP